MLKLRAPSLTLDEDAEQRLVVHIHGSANKAKSVDVSVVDAQGTLLAERHDPYAPTTECHKVLYDTAYGAAEMLGAFKPPPPQEPVTCPTCPPNPPPPICPPSPPAAPLRAQAIMIPRRPTPAHFSVGFGAVVGSGIVSKLSAGPLVLVDVIPASRLSSLHIEIEFAYTSQAVDSTRWHSIPLVGSLCWAPGIVRFCGGFATTILFSNQSSNSELRMFGPNLRVGTELFNHGPISLRADVFGRIALIQQTFGQTIRGLDEASPFMGGVSVLGAWAAD